MVIGFNFLHLLCCRTLVLYVMLGLLLCWSVGVKEFAVLGYLFEW